LKNIIIPIAVLFIMLGAVTVCLVSYFRLQRHRADAAATIGYRKLAEQSVEGQERLHAQLAELTARVAAVEEILRSVG
jgi:hypothetical protein